MTTTVEPPHDADVLATSVPEPRAEKDETPLFPSLDGEANLLTPLWRDADLLG